MVEVTCKTLILRGKHKYNRSIERVVLICSLDPAPSRGTGILERIRRYWNIEGGLHQRLHVNAGEDASGCNRNPLLILGILRRTAMGLYYQWKCRHKSLRQSTLKDFHNSMSRFNHRLAFPTISTRPK
jgi:hypothetical protein